MSDPFSFGDDTPPDMSSLTFPAVDFSSLTSGLQLPVTLGTNTGGSLLDNFNNFAAGITGVAKTIYGSQAQIDQARAQAAIAKAQGQSAVLTAQSGVPSPNLLLLGGAGLLALMLLTSKK